MVKIQIMKLKQTLRFDGENVTFKNLTIFLVKVHWLNSEIKTLRFDVKI